MKIPGVNAIKYQLRKLELANRYLNNKYHIHAKQKFVEEIEKTPLRTDIISFLLQQFTTPTVYLEIGVRNPNDNFNKISSQKKYSVDPGYENAANSVDFKVTSDEFFEMLKSGKALTSDIKFDVIFIDGSHLAEQVEKDIQNSLDYLKEDGFIVMHDCNPPTEFHASENYDYILSPASTLWNGTTWKAFVKNRKREDLYSCCIDTDWGVGVISRKVNFGPSNKIENNFFEYYTFDKHRKESLNLISFDTFKSFFTC